MYREKRKYICQILFLKLRKKMKKLGFSHLFQTILPPNILKKNILFSKSTMTIQINSICVFNIKTLFIKCTLNNLVCNF